MQEDKNNLLKVTGKHKNCRVEKYCWSKKKGHRK